MLQSTYEVYRDSDRYPFYWVCENARCLPHFHSSLEIAYVTQGRTEAMIGGRTTSVAPGELFLVSGCTAHAYLNGSSSTMILLIVPLGFIPLYAPLFSRKVFSRCLSAAGKLNKEVLHCLRRLLALGRCDELNENLVRSYIYVILGLLVRNIGLADTSEDKAFSQEVLLFLQNNYLRPVTLEMLARRFGYSTYRFSHIFNRSVGCSLARYVGSLRARHASNLLRESDAPLLEIAMSSGFDSLRTFYRCFKSCFDMTPTQYRRSIEASSPGAAERPGRYSVQQK